jgi:hypothetical protein
MQLLTTKGIKKNQEQQQLLTVKDNKNDINGSSRHMHRL